MSVEEWEKRRQQRQNVNMEIKTVIWEAMKQLKINRIETRYWGGGDSGQFEEIYAFPKEDDDEVTEEVLELTKSLSEHKVTFKAIVGEYFEDADGNRRYEDRIKEISRPLEEAVDAVANTLLDWTHAGWEINEGGRGSCVFTLSNKEIRLNHESYITTSEHYENVWSDEEE